MGTARLTKLILEVDGYLRHKSIDGTRVHVDAGIVARDLNVTTEAAREALMSLTRMPDSGLNRERGAGGFEFIVPRLYPERLHQLRASLERAERREESAKRMNLTAEILTWTRENPDKMPCNIRFIASELQADANSVSQSLLKLYRAGQLIKSPIGAGWYDKVTFPVASPQELGLAGPTPEEPPADLNGEAPGFAKAYTDILVETVIAPEPETDLNEVFLTWLESHPHYSGSAMQPRQWLAVQEAFVAGYALGRGPR